MIMVSSTDFAYKIWINPNPKMPLTLYVATGVFLIIANWNNILIYVINAIGKVSIKLYYNIFVGTLNILLLIFLAKYTRFGITGVMLATNICLIFASVIFPAQYLRLFNGNANGNLNK